MFFDENKDLQICFEIIYSKVKKKIKGSRFYSRNRLEQSDFFSQRMRGKMKIQLGKPTMNISNLTGGKNEKDRRGALHEK